MRVTARAVLPLCWVVCVMAGVLVSTGPITAWGMDVHRLITARAIDGMPDEIRPLFAADRDFVVEHSVDPDLWRIMDLRGERGDEPPNHFLDMDFDENAKAPFDNIPREWDAYVEKFGATNANRYGRLPWRAEDVYNRIVTNFRDMAKPNPPPYAVENVRYLTAVLSHYIEDAHQPFHGALNYDGQLTNQRGIHARFETELVLRNIKKMALTPVKITVITGFREFMFATLVDSQSLVARVLAADRAAADGREFYDDAYFEAFFKDAGPIAERRLSDAASGVASAVFSAWVEAGRPELPKGGDRTPARIRR